MKSRIRMLVSLVIGFGGLVACTNAFWYGEEGKQLDEAYAKYKGKELYCLGYCLAGCHGKYRVNQENEYIEYAEAGNQSFTSNSYCMAYDAKTKIRLSKDQNAKASCWIATYDTYLNREKPEGSIDKRIRGINAPSECIVDGNQGYIIYDSSMEYDKGALLVMKAPYTPNFLHDTLIEEPIEDGHIRVSDIGTGKFGSWGTKEEADAFNKQMQDEYEANQKKKEDEIRKKEQALKDMEKYYGYSWCSPRYLFFTQDNCMEIVDGTFLKVIQQTDDGTLVEFIKSPDYVFLISKNSKDASLADGYPIHDGILAVDGTYQYTSILGATRTVKRLKRLK